MKYFFLIFLVLVIFSLIGLIINFKSGVTGASSYLNTVKYVSCRYESQDRWGSCFRSEKQLGTKCSPPEDLSRVRNYYKCVDKDIKHCSTPMNWFYRPCSFASKFEGSQNPTFARARAPVED